MIYTATYLPASYNDPSKGGFKTESEAWEYVRSYFCTQCQLDYDKEGWEAILPCSAEWDVEGND